MGTWLKHGLATHGYTHPPCRDTLFPTQLVFLCVERFPVPLSSSLWTCSWLCHLWSPYCASENLLSPQLYTGSLVINLTPSYLLLWVFSGQYFIIYFNKFYYYECVYIFICVCVWYVCGCTYSMAFMWGVRGHLEFTLFFHLYTGSGEPTQVFKFLEQLLLPIETSCLRFFFNYYFELWLQIFYYIPMGGLGFLILLPPFLNCCKMPYHTQLLLLSSTKATL